MFVAKIVVAAGLLAGVLWSFAGPASVWMQAGLAERAARLAIVLAAGGIAYFGALAMLGFRIGDFSRRERGPEPAPVPEE
jgi:putative peptidoglycan lipid II flippase